MSGIFDGDFNLAAWQKNFNCQAIKSPPMLFLEHCTSIFGSFGQSAKLYVCQSVVCCCQIAKLDVCAECILLVG